MDWRPIKDPSIKVDLILFDGDCVLCSHMARIIHTADEALRFRFVAIQSEAGQKLAARFGVNPTAPETNIAIVAGAVSFKSDAALALISAIPKWRWAGAFSALPRSVRNIMYDLVARNRYAWFGKRRDCLIPDAAMRARVIERWEQLG